jgi:hypothetical protein
MVGGRYPHILFSPVARPFLVNCQVLVKLSQDRSVRHGIARFRHTVSDGIVRPNKRRVRQSDAVSVSGDYRVDCSSTLGFDHRGERCRRLSRGLLTPPGSSHRSLLIAHCSPLTAHRSPLIAHRSPLVGHLMIRRRLDGDDRASCGGSRGADEYVGRERPSFRQSGIAGRARQCAAQANRPQRSTGRETCPWLLLRG